MIHGVHVLHGVHKEAEAMRSWWCDSGPKSHIEGESVVCLRWHRHLLAKDDPKRGELLEKIKSVKGRTRGVCANCAADVERMHAAFCGTPFGKSMRLCEHWAKLEHACNTTDGLGLFSSTRSAEKLYLRRVEAACQRKKETKDEL